MMKQAEYDCQNDEMPKTRKGEKVMTEKERISAMYSTI